MSTKVYNAYKFKGTPSALLKHCREYRRLWQQYQTVRLAALQAPTEEAEALAKVEAMILEHSSKQYPTWDDVCDVRGSVAVYFHRSGTYVQTFLSTHAGSRKPPAFTDERFADFHYQNQSDPWYELAEPSLDKQARRAAAANWRQRERIWGSILKDLYSPVEAGFIYEFCSQIDCRMIAREVTGKIRAACVRAAKTA